MISSILRVGFVSLTTLLVRLGIVFSFILASKIIGIEVPAYWGMGMFVLAFVFFPPLIPNWLKVAVDYAVYGFLLYYLGFPCDVSIVLLSTVVVFHYSSGRNIGFSFLLLLAVLFVFLYRNYGWYKAAIILVPISLIYLWLKFDDRTTEFLGSTVEQIRRKFAGGLHSNEPQYIYNFIIRQISSSSLSWLFSTVNIVFAKVVDGDVEVLNWYKQVKSIAFYNEKELKKTLSSQWRIPKGLLVDGIPSANYYTISVQNSDIDYIFFIETRQSRVANVCAYIGSTVLSDVLCKLALDYDAEESIRIQRQKLKEKIVDNIVVIENSRKLAHDMRNRLGSIKNYLTSMKEVEQKMSVSLPPEVKKYLEKERAYSAKTIDQITSHLSQLLERYDESTARKLAPISSATLYGRIAHEVKNKLADFEIEGEWSNNVDVLANETAFDALLENIISNLSRYALGRPSVKFSCDDDYFQVEFKNQFDPQKSSIERSIKILTEHDRKEILTRRRTHGIEIIQDYLDSLKFEYTAETQGDVFSLVIKVLKPRR